MRKKTTRREAMTVGLGAVLLGAAGTDPNAKSNVTAIGHHFKNGVEAEIHVVGTGFDSNAATTVKLEGKYGSTTITWTPNPATAAAGDVTPTRVKVKSVPSWAHKDESGVGSLTVTVTNGGDDSNKYITQDVSYT